MSKIISFEGFEYSGKSTQIKLLKKYFKKNKINSQFTREPGGIKDLEKIRNVIVNSSFTNKSLILFFFASRLELISKFKEENNFGLIVFDRYFHSTYAYQGISKSDKELIYSLIKLIDKKFIPKVTFYLEINKSNLIKRNKKRSENNKFDKVYVKQFDRIKKNYNEIIKNKISNNFIKVNGDNSPEQIHNEILTYLKKCKLI